MRRTLRVTRSAIVLAAATLSACSSSSTGGSASARLQGLFTGQKSVDAVLKDMDTFFAAK